MVTGWYALICVNVGEDVGLLFVVPYEFLLSVAVEDFVVPSRRSFPTSHFPSKMVITDGRGCRRVDIAEHDNGHLLTRYVEHERCKPGCSSIHVINRFVEARVRAPEPAVAHSFGRVENCFPRCLFQQAISEYCAHPMRRVAGGGNARGIARLG